MTVVEEQAEPGKVAGGTHRQHLKMRSNMCDELVSNARARTLIGDGLCIVIAPYCPGSTGTPVMLRRLVALVCVLGAMGMSPAASAQSSWVDPIVGRDENWATVSQVSLAIGVTSLLVTPRVVSWPASKTGRSKASWRASFTVPATTLMAATFVVDNPVKGLVRSTRPGCTGIRVEVTGPGSNCETYGGPSTPAFAAWGTLGTGLGMFIVDSNLYGKNGVAPGAFVGQVAIPLLSAVVVSAGRATNGLGMPFETRSQVFVGALSGLAVGMTLGMGYALVVPPACPMQALICW